MNRDNGSTWGGIMTVLVVIAALISGYYLRDAGYVINIDVSNQEIKNERR